MSKLTEDPRIDPRIKAAFAGLPDPEPVADVADRETLLRAWNSEQHLAELEANKHRMAAQFSEQYAPSSGLAIGEDEFTSSPDGNRVKVRITRPEGDELLPCVYHIHGGGMQYSSCFDPRYSAWARFIAARGVAVVAVDFRNCAIPSTAPEVAPFPAGLNDCVSGVKWLHDEADRLNIDRRRIVVSGESGGGNLTIATGMKLAQDGDIALIQGLYAMCPMLAGQWPAEGCPSSIENNGILLDLHHNITAIAYGIEAFNEQNPLAWPAFASEADVRDLPPTIISVNECDPLRDEGINFYRLLLRAGVAVRCRTVHGTIHGAELNLCWCPDISGDTARDIAAFCRGS